MNRAIFPMTGQRHIMRGPCASTQQIRDCLGIGHIKSTWGITRGCRPGALPSLQQQKTEIINE